MYSDYDTMRAMLRLAHSPGTFSFTRTLFTDGLVSFATALGGDLVMLPDTKELEGLKLRGRSIMAAPIQGNLDGATVVTAQYNQAGTSDGHFVVFDVGAARTQSSKFLGTLAATGQATVVSP